MGWIPGPETDLSQLSEEELLALRSLMVGERSIAQARIQSINRLIGDIDTQLIVDDDDP